MLWIHAVAHGGSETHQASDRQDWWCASACQRGFRRVRWRR